MEAPQSLFYGCGGVHLKVDCCRVIGAGPNLKSSWLPLRPTKKGEILEEAGLHFVGNRSSYHLIGLNPFDLIGVNEFDVLFHETLCSLRLVTSNFTPQSSFQPEF